MNEEAKILLEASHRIEAGTPFAIATVTKTSGSTPREIGARMLVDRNGTIFGTIGGAAIERLAIDLAAECLTSGQKILKEFDLNDIEHIQTGMVCGGRMEVLIEPFGTNPRLHIFGAGHVAQAVAKIVPDLGFDLTIYDQRSDWANPQRFPDVKIEVGDLDQLADALNSGSDDYIAVMTWCHDKDYDILKRILCKPFRYLGVIGSKKKGIEIRTHLKEDGFAPAEIARLSCPLGIPLTTHTPAEIAVSFAAQLLEIRSTQAPGKNVSTSV